MSHIFGYFIQLGSICTLFFLGGGTPLIEKGSSIQDSHVLPIVYSGYKDNLITVTGFIGLHFSI